MMMLSALFWLLVLAFLAKWVFSTPDRALPEQSRRTAAELARLREEVDRLTAQVDRLQEEQSFMVRLLSEGESSTASLRDVPPRSRALDPNPEGRRSLERGREEPPA